MHVPASPSSSSSRPARARAGWVSLAFVGALAFAAPASAAPSYRVVLADGSVVAARTRPAIVMGKVSFVDGASHARTFSVAQVNVEATRRACGPPSRSGRVWTERNLSEVRGRIQILGEEPAPETSSADLPLQTANQAPSGLTQEERLRHEIGQLETRLQPLGATDHKRTVLVTRQRELQAELDRLGSGRS